MLINARALVIAPVEDEPLDHPLLGYRNIVTIDNLVADSELEDYPASNLANPNTDPYHLWRSASSDEQYLAIAVASSDGPVDYLAVARHNFGSAAYAVSVGYFSDDSPEEWVELGTEIIPADDSPILWRFPPQEGLTSLKLRMVPTGSPSDAPEAGVLYVGKLVVFERGVQGPFTPLPYGLKREVTNGQSESGNFQGRIQTGGRRESTPAFSYLTVDWFDENLKAFLEDGGPFFFAWAPSDRPRDVGFAWLRDDVEPAFEAVPGYVSVSLPMTGIVI